MTVSSKGGRAASRPRLPAPGGSTSRFEQFLVAAGILALTAALVLVATRGLVYAALAAMLAVFFVAVIVVGRVRIAIACFLGAFFLAPMYLGISPIDSSTVTPPDVAMLAGGVLLLPSLVGRRVQLPVLYVIGFGVMAMCAAIAAIGASSAVASLFGFVVWIICMAALPVLLAIWRPGRPLVVALAWSYVAGQVFSALGGAATGHIVGGRWYGLSNHPNEFGAAGMMSVALLLFLLHHHRSTFPRVVVWLAGAVSVGTVVVSGGRAATLVVAVLVVMYPIVERSAVKGFLIALSGGIAIAVLPFVLEFTGDESALARLTGGAVTVGADTARSSDREAALDRFFEHFWTGSGSVNFEIFYIHDTLLQVAVSIGVFGAAGFLLVIFSLARPLFSHAPLRRLSYTVWAFIGFAWTTPGIIDRTLWVPMSLAILAALRPLDDETEHPTAPDTDGETRMVGGKELKSA